MGEKITDGAIIEAGDTVESTIRRCASLGNKNMDMRMEIDAISKGLYHGQYSRHKLKICGCEQNFHK